MNNNDRWWVYHDPPDDIEQAIKKEKGFLYIILFAIAGILIFNK